MCVSRLPESEMANRAVIDWPTACCKVEVTPRLGGVLETVIVRWAVSAAPRGSVTITEIVYVPSSGYDARHSVSCSTLRPSPINHTYVRESPSGSSESPAEKDKSCPSLPVDGPSSTATGGSL